ncbi:MAG: hypothetical protein Rubg2KO_26970 [Rubricoccaceae bacterium]
MSRPLSQRTLAPTSRRGFFRRAGAGLGAIAAVSAFQGCDPSDDLIDDDGNGVTLDFSDDFGVLNYAYALEQLEYAFYEAVLAGSYFTGLSASSEERQILQDLRDHELAHVDFLNAALGNNAIGDLEVDFGSVDFSDRTSVLSTAQTLEDTGVSAYNGAGRYLSDPGLLTVAGKIVSVEARHASAIRDVLNGGVSFAGDDVVDPTTGLDVVATPAQVLVGAGPFITTTVRLANVPSS